MDTDKLKKELIGKIIQCSDFELLKEIHKLLNEEINKVNDSSEGYHISRWKQSMLTDEQNEELERRYEEYLKGEGKSYTMEEVEKWISGKYDL